jgi:hypothetical protein
VLALRRVFFRALVVGLGEFVLALALVPNTQAPGTVGYPFLGLFLAFPAALVTLVELLGDRVPLVRRAGVTFVLSLVGAAAGLFVAHLQALYADGVVGRRELRGGLEHLADAGENLPVVATFLVGLTLVFATVETLTTARIGARAVVSALFILVILVLLGEDEATARRTQGLQGATVIVALTLPVFFALADRLARRGAPSDAQVDEQYAR